jgi:CRP/FNR family transcriptional regulator, anaerobic regulatory protein
MLRTNPSFLAFVDELYQTQQYKEHLEMIHGPNGIVLLGQGQKAAKVFVLKEGIVKCVLSEDNGKDYIVEFLGVGEVVGEIEQIKLINCLCSIVAITPIQAYSISADLFTHLMQKEGQFAKLLLETLATRIVNTSSRASYQQLYTLDYALSQLLLLQQKSNIHISKDDMAAYLGITPRSLNRALKSIVTAQKSTGLSGNTIDG